MELVYEVTDTLELAAWHVKRMLMKTYQFFILLQFQNRLHFLSNISAQNKHLSYLNKDTSDVFHVLHLYWWQTKVNVFYLHADR